MISYEILLIEDNASVDIPMRRAFFEFDWPNEDECRYLIDQIIENLETGVKIHKLSSAYKALIIVGLSLKWLHDFVRSIVKSKYIDLDQYFGNNIFR